MPKPDPRHAEILPVVRYSASRKAAKTPDYWDHATLLEPAVLARDEDDANERLGDVLSVTRAGWELETTARNPLADPRHARGPRGTGGLDQAARRHAQGARRAPRRRQG